MKQILKLKLLLAMLLSLFTSMALAQVNVTGTVKDETGQPVPGASVLIKGTQQGTTTTNDGKFAISAKASDILVISYIGYQAQEISVGTQTTINVSLKSATNDLSEVVVVAYGTQKKVNLSGAVNTVDTKTIVNRPTTSLTNALQGTVPGVTVRSSSGDVGNDLGNMNVRGRATWATLAHFTWLMV